MSVNIEQIDCRADDLNFEHSGIALESKLNKCHSKKRIAKIEELKARIASRSYHVCPFVVASAILEKTHFLVSED